MVKQYVDTYLNNTSCYILRNFWDYLCIVTAKLNNVDVVCLFLRKSNFVTVIKSSSCCTASEMNTLLTNTLYGLYEFGGKYAYPVRLEIPRELCLKDVKIAKFHYQHGAV